MAARRDRQRRGRRRQPVVDHRGVAVAAGRQVGEECAARVGLDLIDDVIVGVEGDHVGARDRLRRLLVDHAAAERPGRRAVDLVDRVGDRRHVALADHEVRGVRELRAGREQRRRPHHVDRRDPGVGERHQHRVRRDRLAGVLAGIGVDVVVGRPRDREPVRHAAAAAGDIVDHQPRESREPAGDLVAVLDREPHVEAGDAGREQVLLAAEQRELAHRHAELDVLDPGDVEAQVVELGRIEERERMRPAAGVLDRGLDLDVALAGREPVGLGQLQAGRADQPGIEQVDLLEQVGRRAGHGDLGGAAVAAIVRDRDRRRVDHGEHEAGQELGELIVAAGAVAAGPPQIGVDQGAAERAVDPAQGRLARIPGIDAGIGDHQADLIVLEQEVADPADRVRSADRLVERADPLGACVRRGVAAAGEHRQRDDRDPPAGPPHSASSAASCTRSFSSSRAACSTTWVSWSCTRMRYRGMASTAPTVCSITRSVVIRLDGSRMAKR